MRALKTENKQFFETPVGYCPITGLNKDNVIEHQPSLASLKIKDVSPEQVFVKNLKTLRKRKQLTQDQLALRLCVTRSRLGAWEEGRASPSVSLMFTICEIFRVDLMEMLTQEVE